MTMIEDLAAETIAQARRVTAKYGPMHSPHEALGVLLEEVDEFKREVFARDHDHDRLRAELIDIACVCLRYAAQLAPVKPVCGAPTSEGRRRRPDGTYEQD
jgi:NTP pyrophosphatase (non-canonical NTP hydrolase)